MFDGDIICRAALYPKFITPSGVFDAEGLLRLHSSRGETIYSLSVASLFICKDEKGVHDYGTRAASIANDRFVENNGRDPSPVTEKVHYLGYYELYCGDVRNLKMEYYNPTIYWLPENGMDCHFQVDLEQNKNEGTKKQRRSDRRAAIGSLFDKLWGPKTFISEEDEDHRQELEAVDLPVIERVEFY